MKKPVIRMGILLGALIALAVTLTVSEPNPKRSSDEGKLPGSSKSALQRGAGKFSAEAGANPTSSADEAPPSSGKPKIRPSPDELSRRRAERRRNELVSKIKEMKEDGIGGSHPSMLAASEALQKIDAGQSDQNAQEP